MKIIIMIRLLILIVQISLYPHCCALVWKDERTERILLSKRKNEIRRALTVVPQLVKHLFIRVT